MCLRYIEVQEEHAAQKRGHQHSTPEPQPAFPRQPVPQYAHPNTHPPTRPKSHTSKAAPEVAQRETARQGFLTTSGCSPESPFLPAHICNATDSTLCSPSHPKPALCNVKAVAAVAHQVQAMQPPTTPRTRQMEGGGQQGRAASTPRGAARRSGQTVMKVRDVICAVSLATDMGSHTYQYTSSVFVGKRYLFDNYCCTFNAEHNLSRTTYHRLPLS